MELLHTKLSHPPARKKRVARTHLLQKLDAALHQKLTLVCAPAGYGKTTLLIDWANRQTGQSCWVSLDHSDNDPAQFILYFVAALQEVEPGIGSVIPEMLHPPRPLPFSKILIALINDIAASEKEYLIVLDDYQVIGAQAVHDFLNQLIEHMPGNLHLLVAARADPPLNLPLLRARGQMLELRAGDLCFNSSEASEFLKEVMRLPLSSGEIDALLQKVEGWAAGLQIAAIYLQHQPDLLQAVRTFAGSNRHILDYLAVEVIGRLPNDIQDFLYQIAIVDDLEASLCEAITGRGDSQKILEQLERENQFIIPLDEDRRWYRFHRLMAEALRRQTEKLDSELRAERHRRASAWFAVKGMTAAAIEHAFEAGDIEGAAQLIEANAETALKHSQIATLLEWLDRLPEALVGERRGLNMAYMLALLFKGGSLRAVQARLEASTTHSIGSQATVEEFVIRAMVATLTGNPAQGLVFSQRALEELPAGSSFLRSIAAENFGIACVLQGDTESAIRAFKESSALAQESGNTMFLVAALSNLGGLYLVRGHLHLAEGVYRQALEQATTPTGLRLPVACRALMGLGEIAREWNQLGEARQLLEEAVQLAHQYSETGEMVMCLNLARVHQAQGSQQDALELIQRAHELAALSTASTIDDRLVEAALARYWLQQGNAAGAVEWAARRGFEQVPPGAVLPGDLSIAMPYEIREVEWIVQAHLQLAQGQARAALGTLSALMTEAQQQGRVRRLTEIFILMALAQKAAGSKELAVQFLERSLELAEPEGCTRVYIDEGLPVAKLLREAIRRGIQQAFCRKLLNAIQDEQVKVESSAGRDQGELVEPLSDRELEVLRLLAEGCTNREISERLVISLSTVKGHVANISGKLLAQNRTEAVARARQLGILTQ